ncbi:ABC transporter permease [Paenibacillus daejeonensis]|uniref:ABC transporter permease n=1 Tax=Paenibacillus daejeonensis TaxID=135193 RepID=UPI00037EE978|nr:ABC transporter permease [Paenibacillus daejeonensis]
MVRTIASKEIALQLKDKSVIFWLFVLPIVFIVIFASIFNASGTTSYTVPYYDADGSGQSQQLVGILEGIDGFELETDAERPLQEQLSQISEGRQTMLLVIPEGFGERMMSGEQAEVQLHRDATQDAAVGPVLGVLEGVAGRYQEEKLRAVMTEYVPGEAVEGLLAAPVTVNDIREQATENDPIAQIVPGYTVMFVFFAMISMITRFLKDRSSGMLSRLQGTTMKPRQYLMGMWIPHILIVFIQSAALLTFGRVVYGLQLGNLLALSVIVLALAICVTGLGLMLSMVVGSENMGLGLVQIIALGGAILGGLWFPFEMLPAFVQTMGQFTPQYWAQQGLQDVLLRGAGVGDIWPNLLILLGCGTVGLALAVTAFPRFARKAAA